jgi:U3 small nucleolar RNA-associated protein 21
VDIRTAKSTAGVGAKRTLRESGDGGTVRSVFVTNCGNFGVVGGSEGRVVLWNLQSGVQRRVFDVSPPVVSEQTIEANGVSRKKVKRTEGRPVTGVAVDPLNRVLVACTLDGTVNVRMIMFLLEIQELLS